MKKYLLGTARKDDIIDDIKFFRYSNNTSMINTALNYVLDKVSEPSLKGIIITETLRAMIQLGKEINTPNSEEINKWSFFIFGFLKITEPREIHLYTKELINLKTVIDHHFNNDNTISRTLAQVYILLGYEYTCNALSNLPKIIVITYIEKPVNFTFL